MSTAPETISLAEANLWQRAEGALRAQVPEGWGQGRTAFGGLAGAFALRALEQLEPQLAERGLRSALVSFVGPLRPGPVQAASRILRAGSSVTHAQVELLQAQQVTTSMLAAFGEPRDTRLQTPAPTMPTMPPPEALPAMPFLKGLTPDFSQNYEYRWTTQASPLSGAAIGQSQGWVRSLHPEPIDTAGLIAMLDSWPPPIWSRAKRPFTSSSLSWQIHLRSAPPPGGWPADRWYFYDARTLWAEDGYSDFEARLWSAEGELIASSRQAVAEFSGERRA